MNSPGAAAGYGALGGASTVPGLFGGFANQLEDTIGRFYTVGVRLRR